MAVTIILPISAPAFDFFNFIVLWLLTIFLAITPPIFFAINLAILSQPLLRSVSTIQRRDYPNVFLRTCLWNFNWVDALFIYSFYSFYTYLEFYSLTIFFRSTIPSYRPIGKLMLMPFRKVLSQKQYSPMNWKSSEQFLFIINLYL